MPKAPKPKPSTTIITPSASSNPYDASQRGSKKSAQLPPLEILSIEDMKKLGATNREEFGLAKCTREQYARYLRQGKEFLAACVKRRRETKAAAKDGINDELLSQAFDKPPNKYSADALEWFLIQKCL